MAASYFINHNTTMTIQEALELSTAEQAAHYRHNPTEYKGIGDTSNLKDRKPANIESDSCVYDHQITALILVNMNHGLAWQRMINTDPAACLDWIFLAGHYIENAPERWRNGFEEFLEKCYRITVQQ